MSILDVFYGSRYPHLSAANPGTGGTGGGTGGGTTVPLMSAMWADQVVDGFGINTHLGYGTTTIYRNAGPYPDADTAVVSSLKDIGIRHIRETIATSDTFRTRVPAVGAAAGIDVLIAGNPHFDKSGTYTGPTGAQTVAEANTYYPNYVAALEGLNESDSGPTGWASATTSYQTQLWASGNAAYSILGPSMAGNTYTGTSYPAPLTAYADLASVHVYPGGFRPSNSLDQHKSRYRALCDHTGWLTEGGYENAMYTTQSNPPVPESVSGIYYPNELLEVLNRGFTRFYGYALGDLQRDDGLTLKEQHFGLFAWDAQPTPSWRRKPAGTAMKNFLALCNDPGATPSPTPAGLNVSISGGDTSIRQMLFRKLDGTYLLCIWADKNIWTPGPNNSGTAVTVASQTLTITLGTAATVAQYVPSSSSAVRTTSTGTVHTVTQNVAMTVCRITH